MCGLGDERAGHSERRATALGTRARRGDSNISRYRHAVTRTHASRIQRQSTRYASTVVVVAVWTTVRANANRDAEPA